MTTPFDYDQAIADCANADQSALKALYDREAGWLLSVAQRIVRDRQLAEDVVQDAFVQIWTRAETFNPRLGSGRGWIYTIVRHRALREVRQPSHRRRVDTDDIESIQQFAHEQNMSPRSLQNDPDLAWADQQALLRCLQTLGPETRHCIEAAYIEGYTQAELAEKLEKPLGTIKSWIRRGLIALRGCLQ
jgi:RNA polymerase sigma-70 factor (ECF subfamily)